MNHQESRTYLFVFIKAFNKDQNRNQSSRKMREVYLSIQLLHQSNVPRNRVHSEVLFGAGVKGKAVSHLLALGVCPVERIDMRACGENSGSYFNTLHSYI